jgi:hypothetical protein
MCCCLSAEVDLAMANKAPSCQVMAQKLWFDYDKQRNEFAKVMAGRQR